MKVEYSNTPLGELSSFIRGITFKPDDLIPFQSDGAIACMRTKNVQRMLDESDIIAVPPQFVKRKEQYLKEGDILVSTANSWELVGKNCWVPRLQYKATAGGFISVLRADEHRVFPRYLYHWVSSGNTQHLLRHCGRQTTNISNMDLNRAKKLPIPIPFPNNLSKSLSEQKRIAAILDQADAIRKKRQQAIDELNNLIPAIFYDMFGDPVKNPKGWATKTLGDLCDICRGGSPRPINDYLDGTVPWIKIGDATKGDDLYITSTKAFIKQTGVTKSRYLEPGALIFANCGVSLGFARILKIGGCIHDGWLSFSNFSSELNNIYLLKLINMITKHFQNIAPDGTQPNLNTGIMKRFIIPLPPIDKQNHFARMVEYARVLQEKNTVSYGNTNSLFNSLVQRAFRGEL